VRIPRLCYPPRNDEREIIHLLDVAEKSLADYLGSYYGKARPGFYYLGELYEQIRCDPKMWAHRGEQVDLPDTRHLFWDQPEDYLEEKCLSDASDLFSYIKISCGKSWLAYTLQCLLSSVLNRPQSDRQC
jgi:hypothetical protein